MMAKRFFRVIALGAVCVLAACVKEDDAPEPTATRTILPTATTVESNEPPLDAQTAIAELTSYEGQIDACALVGRAKVEEIIGDQLAGEPYYGISGFPNLRSYCNYNPAGTPDGTFVEGKTITLAVLAREDLAAFDPQNADVVSIFEDGKRSAQTAPGYLEVSGLGDDAYYTSDTGLNVLSGSYGLAVHGLTMEQDRQIMEAALEAM